MEMHVAQTQIKDEDSKKDELSVICTHADKMIIQRDGEKTTEQQSLTRE